MGIGIQHVQYAGLPGQGVGGIAGIEEMVKVDLGQFIVFIQKEGDILPVACIVDLAGEFPGRGSGQGIGEGDPHGFICIGEAKVEGP